MTKFAFRKFKKVSVSQGSNLGVGASILSVNKKKLLLLVLPLILSVAFKLYVANSVVGDGQKLAQVESQTEETLRKNKILSEEIAKSNSLAQLENQAQTLGMVKANNVKYIEPTQIGQSSQTEAFVLR